MVLYLFSPQTLLRYHACLYHKLRTPISTYLDALVMHSAIALPPVFIPSAFIAPPQNVPQNVYELWICAFMITFSSDSQRLSSLEAFIFSLWSPRTLFVLVGLTKIPCSELPLSKSKTTLIMDQRNVMEWYLYFSL